MVMIKRIFNDAPEITGVTEKVNMPDPGNQATYPI